MAGFDDVGINILVTCHAGVRADIKTAEIAHARGDAHGVSPVFPSVTSQPRFGSVMTTFAGNAFVRVRGRGQACRANGLER